MTGVGVVASFASTKMSTPFAVNTSSAVASAGRDRAWVSMPANSGPSMPLACRYWQIAWLIAARAPR